MGFLKKFAIAADVKLAAATLRVFPEASTLLILAFHSLFASREEVALHQMDPQQAITVEMFRGLVENLREHGYRIVSPDEIVRGLDAGERAALLTFDDGYANNRRALAVLEEFRAPAVFSISTSHVQTGKPFWWDVLYREARQRDWPEQKLAQARSACKHARTCEAEKQIIDEFGRAAFRTVSDLDRPFTPAELASFARHPLVHIGNHTSDHAILTNYTAAEVHEQIIEAQKALRTITRRMPNLIAYPNGNVSRPALEVARAAGIRLGVTVQPGRNSIPSTCSVSRALQLKRFTPSGTRDIAIECAVARSPISLRAGWAAARSMLWFGA